MSRKYAMKVADMKALAEKCERECDQLTRETRKAKAAALESLRGAATLEALGALEVLDDCRRLIELLAEYRHTAERVCHRVHGLEHLVGSTGNGYRSHEVKNEWLTELVDRKHASEWVWEQLLPREVRDHADFIMQQRVSGTEINYQPPNARDLLLRFKEMPHAADILGLYLTEKNRARAYAGLDQLNLAAPGDSAENTE